MPQIAHASHRTCNRKTRNCPTAKQAMKDVKLWVAMKAGTKKHNPARVATAQIRQADCAGVAGIKKYGVRKFAGLSDN